MLPRKHMSCCKQTILQLSVHKQIWRHPFTLPVPAGNTTLDLHDAASDSADCRVYLSETKHDRRRLIPPAEPTPTRVAALPIHFQRNPPSNPNLPKHRLVCLSPKQADKQIRQLASGHGGLGSERLCIEMAGPGILYMFPPRF